MGTRLTRLKLMELARCHQVQFDHPSIKTAMSLYIYACRQEYWNRDDCFMQIHTFSFHIDWFTPNYKDKTDSKLTESGLCTHIIQKTCVLQERHGKGTQLNIGEFVLRQK